MHLFYQPDIAAGTLSDEDSRHAVKVLRLGKGEEIEITDGKGNFHKATIDDPDARKCRFKITKSVFVPRRKFSVHLAVAPTKNMDRMEWLVEKCTEIGVERISFVHCRTSERKSLTLDRLQKICVSALKQSRQAWLPELAPLISFTEFAGAATERHKFIAHVDESNPDKLQTVLVPHEDCLIVIGPEGDFSKDEIDFALKNQFKKVSLGPNRLRTETAALAAVITANLVNQK